MGAGLGARGTERGRAGGSPLPCSNPPPVIPLMGGGKWGGGAINTSRIPKRLRREGVAEDLREGAKAVLGHPCQGAWAPWAAAGAPGGRLACGCACESSGSAGRRPARSCSPSPGKM